MDATLTDRNRAIELGVTGIAASTAFELAYNYTHQQLREGAQTLTENLANNVEGRSVYAYAVFWTCFFSFGNGVFAVFAWFTTCCTCDDAVSDKCLDLSWGCHITFATLMFLLCGLCQGGGRAGAGGGRV